jgi:ankyrin repeat protein
MIRRKIPEDWVTAVQDDNLAVVRHYLNNGFDPNNLHLNDKEFQGRPLLAYAALHGHIKTMKLLIEYGAKVDRKDLHGRTPLSWAAEFCELEAIKFLIEHGADINAEDENLGTPLAWFINTGEKEDMRHAVHDYLLSQGAEEELHHTLLFWFCYSIAAEWNHMVFKIRR